MTNQNTPEQIVAEAMVNAGAPLMGPQVEEAVVAALGAAGLLATAGVAPQEQLSDDDLLKKYTSAVDEAMKAAHARDGFASNMSRESIVAGLRAVTLAAQVAVDEAKLTEIVRGTIARRPYTDETRRAIHGLEHAVGREISWRSDEWLGGGVR